MAFLTKARLFYCPSVCLAILVQYDNTKVTEPNVDIYTHAVAAVDGMMETRNHDEIGFVYKTPVLAVLVRFMEKHCRVNCNNNNNKLVAHALSCLGTFVMADMDGVVEKLAGMGFFVSQ